MPTYRIDCYRSRTADDEAGSLVTDLMDGIVSDNGVSGVTVIDADGHIIAGLRNSGGLYRGAFIRIRTEDLPRVTNDLGQESDLDLAQNEGLGEKNFFVYDAERGLLLWQVNGNGCHVSRFAKFLSDQVDSPTRISPILRHGALERLMSGDVLLSKFELSFALPTNPELYPDDDNSQRMMELLNGIDADSIVIKAAANAPGRNRNRKSFRSGTKAMLSSIADMPGTRIVRATVDGANDEIDLISDRLSTFIEVRSRGRYPDPNRILPAMTECIEELQDELDAFFGDEENRID